MDIQELRQQVLDICKKLPLFGLVTGTAGNVSARDQDTGLVAIKPSGVPYESMVPEDIVVLRLDGSIVECRGGLKSSFETPTHLEIYRRYEQIGGIIHTHAKYVNTIGCVFDEIPCGTTPTGVRLLKQNVPVIDFINNGTQEMADRVAPVLADHVAVEIRNHGPFTIGETVQLALERAVALEDTSEIFFQASLLGTPSLIGETAT